MNKQSRPVVILLYFLLFLGLFTQNSIVLIALIPCLVFLLSGYFLTYKNINLQAERSLDVDRTTRDNPINICLKITNHGEPIEALYVEDIIPAGLQIVDGNSSTLATLDSGQTLQLNYAMEGRRGAYSLQGVKIRVSDYLGLNQKEDQLPVESRVLVLPQVNRLPEIAIQPRRTRAYPGLIPSGKAGAGVTFFGVREYHTGDPMRWINERASARHEGQLLVNEFEQERAVDVGIILDCRTETNLFLGNAALLEHSVQAAATLADSFLTSGNRVGLLVYGGGRISVQPGYGKIQRERIIQALASVRVYDRIVDKTLENLPTRLFPAKSQLVLISSLLPEDLQTLISLRAYGYKLLVISPDPIEFETTLLGDTPTIRQAARIARVERDFLIRMLRRSGARVMEWQVQEPFYQAASYALSYAAFWQIKKAIYHA